MASERPAATIDPDALTLGGVVGGDLRGRPVTVLGFARSGIAAARFLADAGARVTVYDGRPAAELSAAIEALEGRDVALALGPTPDPAEAWRGAALVVTSPSINPDYPTTEPRLRAALASLVAARAAGDRTAPALVSEPDLFLRLCPSPTIGVTGTKGKTTTASLTAALLAADADHPVVLGGNIGTPLIERLPELTPEHRVVIELSELQLPTLSRGTTVALYTNVTADHLDRHGTVEAYRLVKRRLAELAPADGAIVLNLDDPIVASYADGTAARVATYQLGPPRPGGVGVRDGWIEADAVVRVAAAGGGADRPGGVDRLGGVDVAGAAALPVGGRAPLRVMPVEELAIPGRHNVSNALGAVAVALTFGVDPAAVRRAAATFTGVEHRLETVLEFGGVRYVNDSQGTQPDAVIAALRAFPAPLVLIAGGRDKGVDLTELAAVVAERASAAVLIGESAADLAGRFGAAGLRRVERAASLEDAVELATGLARAAAGDAGPLATVLLSPAAASFDMFEDYAARGRAFKAAVRRIAGTELA